MFIRNLIFVIFSFLVAIFHISFFSNLDGYPGHLDIILIGMVFTLVFWGAGKSLTWTLICALILDIFYFMPPGLFLLSFLIAYSVMFFSFNNFLTNFSLYSVLLLTFLVVISYYSVWAAIFYILGKGSYLGPGFFAKATVSNLVFSFILFYVILFFTNRVSSIFLISKYYEKGKK